MDTSQAFSNVAHFVEKTLKQRHIHMRPAPKDIKLCIGCHLAEKDHKEIERVYAHTYHLDGVICVCEAFGALATGSQYGILLHEFGHLYGGKEECDADLWVDENLGVDIEYKGTGVQNVSPGKVEKA